MSITNSHFCALFFSSPETCEKGPFLPSFQGFGASSPPFVWGMVERFIWSILLLPKPPYCTFRASLKNNVCRAFASSGAPTAGQKGRFTGYFGYQDTGLRHPPTPTLPRASVSRGGGGGSRASRSRQTTAMRSLGNGSCVRRRRSVNSGRCRSHED